MAVSAKQYGLFLKSLATKKIDLSSDTLKVMLCTASYSPNQNTHQFKSSVTNEVTGPGYTAGGKALANVTLTYDAATKTLILDSDDPAWAASTITARYAVFYDDAPATDATKPLISFVDFGADVSSTSGAFTITLDALGIADITVA